MAVQSNHNHQDRNLAETVAEATETRRRNKRKEIANHQYYNHHCRSWSMSMPITWSRSWLNKQYYTTNNNTTTRGRDHGSTSYTTTAKDLPGAAVVVVAKQAILLPRINRGRKIKELVIKS